MRLDSPAVVAEVLRRRALRPTRRWGQNFLIDGNLLQKVVDAADLRSDEGVLEIGPGLGALTRSLAQRVERVLAVEIDPGLYAALIEETLRGLANVTVLRADFLELDLSRVIPETLGPGRHPVVANIPYSITSPVIVRLLESALPAVGPPSQGVPGSSPAPSNLLFDPLFDRIILMMQKEVADRIVAAPGTSGYGSLTLFVHLYADARRVAPAPRRAFLPVPDVDSAIVRLDVLPAPRFPAPERYLAVVHAAFQQRRKRLSNALTGPALGWSREHAAAALGAAGIDPGRRGETLQPEEFAQIARQWPRQELVR